jgi:thymidylate synthase ThyX
MPREIEVDLIDWPRTPRGTLFYLWEQSRTDNPLPSPDVLEAIMDCQNEMLLAEPTSTDEPSKMAKGLEMLGAVRSTIDSRCVMVQEVRQRLNDTVARIIDENIPVTENLFFVFAIRNMSVSLREQMVRHRIGSKPGFPIGSDIVPADGSILQMDQIPDLADSTWWSQTMRVIPMGEFADQGRYLLPETLEGKTVNDVDHEMQDPRYVDWKATEYYEHFMGQCQHVYNKLVAAGVPAEDARQVLPLGVTHKITWGINLKALQHVLGKRSCWVSQAGLWENLIAQMAAHLVKVHPIFRNVILPPCFKKGKYTACPVELTNQERIQGRDRMPPCPLFVYNQTSNAVIHHANSVNDTGEKASWTPPITTRDRDSGYEVDVIDQDLVPYAEQWNGPPVEKEMMLRNIEKYQRLWKLDIHTGETLAV